jgi:hypothetical protein
MPWHYILPPVKDQARTAPQFSELAKLLRGLAPAMPEEERQDVLRVLADGFERMAFQCKGATLPIAEPKKKARRSSGDVSSVCQAFTELMDAPLCRNVCA